MKSMRILLSLLLVPLTACAGSETARCPDTQCAKQASVPSRTAPRSAGSAAISPAAPVVVPPRDAAPSPPPTVGICDPGGCWDTGGNRYNGGAGGTFLNGSGRLCQRNGISIQCF